MYEDLNFNLYHTVEVQFNRKYERNKTTNFKVKNSSVKYKKIKKNTDFLSVNLCSEVPVCLRRTGLSN